MSRIGKKPVPVPAGVSVALAGQTLKVKGKKGELSLVLMDEMTVEVGKESVALKPREDTKRARMMWGMQRSLVANMVTGVTAGFSESLEISGVGYRAAVAGRVVELQLGYSHVIKFPIPAGIEIKAEKPTLLHVTGADKQMVGQVSAEIRGLRRPEPYKGKGIRYENEQVRRKEGKSFTSGG